MHRRSLLISLGALGLALAACKPSYPNCEKDEHCADKGEYCVNQTCQECRDDSHCVEKHGDKHECLSGRCEPYECRSDNDCTDNLVCRSKACVPECTEDTDCGAGKKCEEQRCVDECSSDVECAAGQVCQNGMCQEADTQNISAACRPTNPGSGQIVALETVRFDFDRSDLRVDARTALDQNAECLKQAPGLTLVVEGHADERGTQEYNLALGERRATSVMNYLRNMGIESHRMRVRSKGENEPECRQQTESCYFQNRRVEFIQQRAGM